MNTVNHNMEVVRAFIRSFWNEGNLDCTDRYLTADYVDHAYVPGNIEGLRNMAVNLHTAFPNQTSEEESIVAQGDRVVVRLIMRGHHQGEFRGTQATHNPIESRVYREYRLENGKIAEHWALFDTAALLRQIGADLTEQNACKIERE